MTLLVKIPINTHADDYKAKKNDRRNTAKQGPGKWFDVLTTVWAITLVIATITWMTAPAFARGEVDCYEACVALDKCEGAGGCYTASKHAGECWGECGDGSSWECGYGGAV